MKYLRGHLSAYWRDVFGGVKEASLWQTLVWTKKKGKKKKDSCSWFKVFWLKLEFVFLLPIIEVLSTYSLIFMLSANYAE